MLWKKEDSKTVILSQLESLGETCALMHKGFFTLSVKGVKGFPIEGGKLLSSLRENDTARKQMLCAHEPFEYQKTLLAQGPILEHLTDQFFLRFPKGIGHEDFTSDNLLFYEHSLSAVIDFDRNQYSFLWHDMGRAILSFFLEEDRLDIEKMRALPSGYSRRLPFTLSNAIAALRVTWRMESLWWIQPEYFKEFSGKATRYRDEIQWLTFHWFQLEELFNS